MIAFSIILKIPRLLRCEVIDLQTLAENGHGHLVGDRLTMADVQLLEVLLAISDLKPETFDNYPNAKV